MIIFTPVTGGITDKKMNICDTCAAIELEKKPFTCVIQYTCMFNFS